MTAKALVTGAIFRTPERLTARSGRAYVAVTIRTRDGDAAQFWRVTIFSESAGEEVMRLQNGDAVTVQGAMQAELYRPDGGEPRVSLSIIADQVLALRSARKPKEKRQDEPGATSSARTTAGRVSPYAPHGAHPSDRHDFKDDAPF